MWNILITIKNNETINVTNTNNYIKESKFSSGKMLNIKIYSTQL